MWSRVFALASGYFVGEGAFSSMEQAAFANSATLTTADSLTSFERSAVWEIAAIRNPLPTG